MWLCHLQTPDKVHEHSGEHCSHELSGDLESPHPERGPAAPHGLQGPAGIACAAGEAQAVQDGEAVGEGEGGVRLRLHVAEQAELVRAGANLEGAEHLHKESEEERAGAQPAPGQPPAQSHGHHDAGQQQQGASDPTDSHAGASQARGLAEGPAPPPAGRKKAREGGKMPPLSLGGRNQLLPAPARSLTHPPLGGAKGRGEGRGIPLPARARLRTGKLSPGGGKAREGERGQRGTAAPSAPPPRDGLPCPLSLPEDRERREGLGSRPRGNGRGADFPGGIGVAVCPWCEAAPAPARSRARARPRRPLRRALRSAHAGGARGALRERPGGPGERGGAGAGTGHGPGCPWGSRPSPRGLQRARERDIGYLFRVAQACVLGGVQQKEHANYQNFFYYLYIVAHTGITESQKQ